MGTKAFLAEVKLQASLAFTHFRTAEKSLPKLFMRGELPKSDTLFTLLLLVQLLQVRPGRELGVLPSRKGF